MNGFNVAEAGHTVNVLVPQNITGGVTGQAFSMKNAEHVSIIIQIGAIGASMPTAILLNACTSAAGAGATAMPFRYYILKNGGATTGDLLSPPVYATATGILQAVISKLADEYIIIEVDAAEIDYLGDGDGVDYPYLQLQITDSGNNTYMSAVAILSGLRQSYQGGVTATA